MKSAPAGELLVEDIGPLRRCTLARLNRRNALSLELCRQLQSAVEAAGSDVALIVFRHEGDTFSSGADLREIAPALTDESNSPTKSPTLRAIRELFRAIEGSGKPIVAAVNGRCLAGGLELALACDLIVATKSARFFDGHLAGGLLPGGGAAVRLAERVGSARAFRLLIEGVELGADEAQAWGLTDVVVDGEHDLDQWARKLAAKLSAYPPGLAAGVKRQLSAGRHPRDGNRFVAELDELESYTETHRSELRQRLQRYR